MSSPAAPTAASGQQTGAANARVTRKDPRGADLCLQSWIQILQSDQPKRALPFVLVAFAIRHDWDAAQVSREFLVPQRTCNHYIQAYNAQGIDGLGRPMEGGDDLGGLAGMATNKPGGQGQGAA